MFRLNDQVAIVTGGGSGIGKSIAQLLAKQGAYVYIFDIDSVSAESALNEIKDEGGQASFVSCNVADKVTIKEAVTAVINTSGKIDILINNAGIAHVGTAETTSENDFTSVFNTNVRGVYNCLNEVIPFMKAKGGVILNMCSITASVGLADRFAYSMSKGAVLGMTLSTAKDYLAYNIRCNSISPARINTPFVQGFINKNYSGNEAEMFEKLSKSQPIGRMGTTNEVAHLALYLCSPEAAFITGCDYPIDGGFIKLNS